MIRQRVYSMGQSNIRLVWLEFEMNQVFEIEQAKFPSYSCHQNLLTAWRFCRFSSAKNDSEVIEFSSLKNGGVIIKASKAVKGDGNSLGCANLIRRIETRHYLTILSRTRILNSSKF